MRIDTDSEAVAAVLLGVIIAALLLARYCIPDQGHRPPTPPEVFHSPAQ